MSGAVILKRIRTYLFEKCVDYSCFIYVFFSYSFQAYIDSLAVADAEDSSYDSDDDAEDVHEQVSRTSSDTLGQEFAEYVSQPPLQGQVRLIFIH